MSLSLIETSLELAAERCDDLTPIIYARLFSQYPDMQTLFWRDTNHSVKGEMLAQVIEAILDFAGERKYAASMIQCEVITHAGYDVPPDVFRIFFKIVADSLRDLIGTGWTAPMEAAWQDLLEQLDFYVTHPDQYETLQSVRG